MVPGLDARFDELVSRALKADPQERFQSATSFRAALDQILTQPVPKAHDSESQPIPLAKVAGKGGGKKVSRTDR